MLDFKLVNQEVIPKLKRLIFFYDFRIFCLILFHALISKFQIANIVFFIIINIGIVSVPNRSKRGREIGGSRCQAYPAKPFRFIQRIWLRYLASRVSSILSPPPEESINNEQLGDRDLIPVFDESTCSSANIFSSYISCRENKEERKSEIWGSNFE